METKETNPHAELYENYLKANDKYFLGPVYRIKTFIRYCENNKIDYINFTYPEFQKFVALLVDRKLCNGSINAFINTIRSFYSFLFLIEKVNEKTKNEIYKQKILPYSPEEKDYLTEEELEEALDMAMSFIERFHPYQTRAIFHLLYYSGLRIGEIAQLKRDMFDLDNYELKLRVRTKTRRQRSIALPEICVHSLREYFKISAEETNALNLSPSQIGRLIKEANDFMPKQKHITPHSFRHGYISWLFEHDVAMNIVQEQVGHTDITTTASYAKPSLKKRKEVIAQIRDIRKIQRVYDLPEAKMEAKDFISFERLRQDGEINMFDKEKVALWAKISKVKVDRIYNRYKQYRKRFKKQLIKEGLWKEDGDGV
jgi:site-specific recombinase XerD